MPANTAYPSRFKAGISSFRASKRSRKRPTRPGSRGARPLAPARASERPVGDSWRVTPVSARPLTRFLSPHRPSTLPVRLGDSDPAARLPLGLSCRVSVDQNLRHLRRKSRVGAPLEINVPTVLRYCCAVEKLVHFGTRSMACRNRPRNIIPTPFQTILLWEARVRAISNRPKKSTAIGKTAARGAFVVMYVSLVMITACTSEHPHAQQTRGQDAPHRRIVGGDSTYLWEAVGKLLDSGCGGTAISGGTAAYYLTAKHCVRQVYTEVEFPMGRHWFTSLITSHPSTDLALYCIRGQDGELERSYNGSTIPIALELPATLGSFVLAIGYGPTAPGGSAGMQNSGRAVYDGLAPSNAFPNSLMYFTKASDAAGTGLLQPGDSGGPDLTNYLFSARVVGVHSAVAGPNIWDPPYYRNLNVAVPQISSWIAARTSSNCSSLSCNGYAERRGWASYCITGVNMFPENPQSVQTADGYCANRAWFEGGRCPETSCSPVSCREDDWITNPDGSYCCNKIIGRSMGCCDTNGLPPPP